MPSLILCRSCPPPHILRSTPRYIESPLSLFFFCVKGGIVGFIFSLGEGMSEKLHVNQRRLWERIDSMSEAVSFPAMFMFRRGGTLTLAPGGAQMVRPVFCVHCSATSSADVFVHSYSFKGYHHRMFPENKPPDGQGWFTDNCQVLMF